MSVKFLTDLMAAHRADFKDPSGRLVAMFKPGIKLDVPTKELADVILGGLNPDPRLDRTNKATDNDGNMVGGQAIHELVWRINEERMERMSAIAKAKTTADREALAKKPFKRSKEGVLETIEVPINTLELILRCAQQRNAQQQQQVEIAPGVNATMTVAG